MKKLRPHLSYANVTATIALFCALGGAGAVAADKLAPRSVGAPQLRPGAVTAKKLRKNAVTAPKIKAKAVKSGKLANFSVKETKLANGAVTNQKLAAGSVGNEKLAPEAVSGEKVLESSLGQVPSANSANTAAFAASADPAAFAKVDQEGNVDAALSKGGVAVTQGKEGGIYCVTVPGFAPRGAQVTPEYNGSGQIRVFVTIGGAPECPAPQVEVRTWNNVSLTKAPFYIVLYR